MENEYQKYLEAVNAIDINNASEKEVDDVIDQLIKVLPNEGKLYKYRNFGKEDNTTDEKDPFSLTYKSLKENYIWLAAAKDLNDEFEGTIPFDKEKKTEELRNYFSNHPQDKGKLIAHLKNRDLKLKNKSFSQEDMSIIYQCIEKCFIVDLNMISIKNAIDFFENNPAKNTEIYKFIASLNGDIKEMTNDEEDFYSMLIDGYKSQQDELNTTMKNSIKIFSMSESYNIDSMWSHYSNNNGFCIEYDFNKLKSNFFKNKQFLCYLFQIEYGKKEAPFPLSSFVPDIIYQDSNYKSPNVVGMMRKDPSWSYEKEWRITNLTLNDRNLFHIDLVSGIIIDEKAKELFSHKYQKLVQLAKERGWTIKTRKLNLDKSAYEYE